MNTHIKHWLRLIIPANTPKQATRHNKYGSHSHDESRKEFKPPNGGVTEYGYRMFNNFTQ